jgi:hypothetical protein
MPNDYMPYMQMMNIPAQYYPMMEMPQQQLESMYPRCYYMIYPEVHRHSDMLCAKYGPMYTPSKKLIDAMVDDIDNTVGADVDAEYQDAEEDKDNEERQLGFGVGHFGFDGRRRFRRDLISILLLRELIHRRPHHHHFENPYRYDDEFGGYPY